MNDAFTTQAPRHGEKAATDSHGFKRMEKTHRTIVGSTMEQMNSVLDGDMPEIAAFPERDRLMLELLYGCGIRNSELVGVNLDDIRLSAEAILIRGKGKKERYVPFGDGVTSALAGYLPV